MTILKHGIDQLITITELIINHTVLPYTKLEYIQSTGTQYINSNILCKSTLKCQVKFSTDKHSGGCFVGNRGTGESNAFRFFTAGSGTWYLDFGSGESYNRISGGSASINTIYNVEFGNRYIKNLDTGSNIISSSVVGSFTKSYNLNICNSGENLKIYYCKIYDNNELVRDFIPTKRISDNVICMYDKITKQFFLNEGTGDFVPGPEI